MTDAPPEQPSIHRNPNWTRDELILALDTYFDVPSPDQRQPPVVELSGLLNRYWLARGQVGHDKFRNANGVSMKLANFQRLDPRFQERGRKGLTHGGRLEEEIWREFGDDRSRLRRTAAVIRETIERLPAVLGSLGAPSAAEEDEPDAIEGAVLTRLHRYRERDTAIVRRRKARAMAEHGRLLCEACDFDFGKVYGPRGVGLIEVHHTRPLETLEPGSRTKLSDLALLCANCHRIVHARRPWLSMPELRALVRAAQ